MGKSWNSNSASQHLFFKNLKNSQNIQFDGQIWQLLTHNNWLLNVSKSTWLLEKTVLVFFFLCFLLSSSSLSSLLLLLLLSGPLLPISSPSSSPESYTSCTGRLNRGEPPRSMPRSDRGSGPGAMSGLSPREDKGEDRGSPREDRGGDNGSPREDNGEDNGDGQVFGDIGSLILLLRLGGPEKRALSCWHF